MSFPFLVVILSQHFSTAPTPLGILLPGKDSELYFRNNCTCCSLHSLSIDWREISFLSLKFVLNSKRRKILQKRERVLKVHFQINFERIYTMK